ncbi:IclR family transcriptional regulator [Virgibacillus necropolis]|uniref:IclR family transcriptional regulator n=1 Tax=Virgibacillus necropolis TaxID=163877 RepID=A0A221MEU3_9BACI|nr:IclR family transcriptional regulator [Virgibacillus necropolis]ASN06142.1 IclR family transcriptional regulator [Virgibacillus necropolis]
MQTIDRTMQITRLLSSSELKKGLSISNLSKQCNLPLSTMHRLLKAMKKHGLVIQNSDTKLYALGTTWLEYGLQLYDNLDYVEVIRTELERLMQEVEETVYFSKPNGLDSLIVERIDCQSNPIRIYDQLGIRIPMHIGAANKVMLANMSTQQAGLVVNTLVEENGKEEFWNTLNRIKKQGFGESHGEKTPNTSALGAPVFNHLDELIGAVSIGFINFNLTDERLHRLIEQIIKTGMRISSKLGYKNSASL